MLETLPLVRESAPHLHSKKANKGTIVPVLN
jgi:hypothetical protein